MIAMAFPDDNEVTEAERIQEILELAMMHFYIEVQDDIR